MSSSSLAETIARAWHDDTKQWMACEMVLSKRHPSTREQLYYVHFCDWADPRMDAWLPAALLQNVDFGFKKNKTDQKSNKRRSRGDETDDGSDVRTNKKQRLIVTPKKFKQKKVDDGGDDDPAHPQIPKTVASVVLGRHQMDTWYFSPYPKEVQNFGTLHLCEFCLGFFAVAADLTRHSMRGCVRHPPGNEIYREGDDRLLAPIVKSETEEIGKQEIFRAEQIGKQDIFRTEQMGKQDKQDKRPILSLFEVDGAKEVKWCENLCYLSRLFLEHKVLWEDTSLFYFYVLCEVDDRGCHIVGYFSKDRTWNLGLNLACILTLPCHQRKGYGSLLISLAYELSKLDQRVGTPERPLSDLGQTAFQSYWAFVLVSALRRRLSSVSPTFTEQGSKKRPPSISIQELVDETNIAKNDVISCLQHDDLRVLVDDAKAGWVFDGAALESAFSTVRSVRLCDPSKFHYVPLTLGRRRHVSEFVGQI